VKFGLDKSWLTDDAATDLGIDRVTAGDESRDVGELASVLPHEKYKAVELSRVASGKAATLAPAISRPWCS
jgi:hypothetical protein